MDTADLSGVEMVLAGLTADSEKPVQPATRAPARRKQSPAVNQETLQQGRREETSATPASRKSLPTPHHTRMGRPPGRKSADTTLKRKTTISLDAALMDAYADRSWKEKVQLGELVGRALEFYRERDWGRNA
jgi:hypothetical protein